MMLTDRGAIAAMKRVFLVAMLLASSAPAFAQTVFGRVGPQEANDNNGAVAYDDGMLHESPPTIDHTTGDARPRQTSLSHGCRQHDDLRRQLRGHGFNRICLPEEWRALLQLLQN